MDLITTYFCKASQVGYHGNLFGGRMLAWLDEAGAAGWFADYWDKLIPVIEARLAAHGKPFVGGTDRPTIADFKAIQTVIGSNPDFNPACIVPTAIGEQLAAKQAASTLYH